MVKEMGFFGWMQYRIKKLISDSEGNFDCELLMWNNRNIGDRQDNYYVYQTEDLHLAHKLTPNYKKFLDNATRVYDYSQHNIIYYPRAIHLPLKFEKIEPKNNVTNNTILFYGYLSDRRKKIIDVLKKNGYIVNCFDGLFDVELGNKLKEYRYVLSIGTYDNITNDSFRIIPAIEHGNIVIAERTQEEWFNQYLIDNCNNRVIFFDYDTIINDIKKIDK